MIFNSDNWASASPKIGEAIQRASTGLQAAYGADDLSVELGRRFSALFGREAGFFLVPTGTASNALALAALARPDGLILAHDDAHIVAEEAGAPEFLTLGARMHPIAGRNGKITAGALEAALAEIANGFYFRAEVLSLSQSTESGTLYTAGEIAELTGQARAAGLRVHMDGARFANAVAALNGPASDLTANVDALSFGLTKNGAWMAEAVVLFDPALVEAMAWRRKRSGHIISKARFIAAQFLAMLDDDHWLALARHANAAAGRLGSGLQQAGYRLVWPVEANEVFLILPDPLIEKLRAAGAGFYDWPLAPHPDDPAPGQGERIVRLVASFATTDDQVEEFIRLARAG